MERNEFVKDLQVDPNQLDLDAVTQGELFFKWAERAVEAKARVDKKKLALDITQAELQTCCREKPEKFGLVRVTEGAINAAVQIHKEYVEAYEKYLDARSDSALLDKAVMAMEMRKRMIEVLITLHGQEYFAGPSVPRDLVGAWKEYQEERGEKVQERQKKALKKRKIIRKREEE